MVGDGADRNGWWWWWWSVRMVSTQGRGNGSILMVAWAEHGVGSDGYDRWYGQMVVVMKTIIELAVFISGYLIL